MCLLTGSPISEPLKVNLWQADTYLGPEDEGPEELINLEDIVSHVVRQTALIGDQMPWATVIVSRVCDLTFDSTLASS